VPRTASQYHAERLYHTAERNSSYRSSQDISSALMSKRLLCNQRALIAVAALTHCDSASTQWR